MIVAQAQPTAPSTPQPTPVSVETTFPDDPVLTPSATPDLLPQLLRPRVPSPSPEPSPPFLGTPIPYDPETDDPEIDPQDIDSGPTRYPPRPTPLRFPPARFQPTPTPTPDLGIDLDNLALIPDRRLAKQMEADFSQQVTDLNQQIGSKQADLQHLLMNWSSDTKQLHLIQAEISALRTERDRLALEHLLILRQLQLEFVIPASVRIGPPAPTASPE